MVLKRITVISIALCLAIAGASATAAESRAALEQFIDHSFPDNSDIRAKFSTRLITAPKEQVWDFGSKVQASKAGQVLVKSVKRSDDFLVQFVNGSDGKFADCSLGSYVIERNCKTGYILQAKVFLEDDPSCYARLYPQGEGTKLDIVMYGALVKKGLYVSGLIYHVLQVPFSDIVDQTDRAFDWSTVFKLGKQSATAGIVADLRSSQAAPQPETPHIELASMPSPFSAAPAAQSPAANPPSSSERLVAAVSDSLSFEDLVSRLSGLGLSPSELAPAATALGLSNDKDPLVPAAYKPFPRYAEAGLPAAAVRGALYLASLDSPNSVYALIGAQGRIIAAPTFDEQGRIGFAFFSGGREIAWQDVKDDSLRVLRFEPRG
jgi:hypothetical protein